MPSEPEYFESLYPPESRSTEIEAILNYVRQGQSCQIVGLPGVGQSTLLKLLVHNKKIRLKHLGDHQGEFHFVLVNFSEMRKRPLVDVTKFMFLSLVDSLRDRQMIDEHDRAYTLFKEAIVLNDELVLFQGLKHALDVLILERGLTIIFLFDRFEEYVPMLTDDFFTNLRALRNRAKYRFSAVFSVNRPLEETIEPLMMADFFDFLIGNTIYMQITDEPGLTFRLTHQEELSGKKLTPKTRSAILSLTGGLGRLAKTCAQVILDNNHDHDSNPQTLATYLLSQKQILPALYALWQTFTPSEQSMLLSVKNNTVSGEDYPHLKKTGLLVNGQISIPLFALFIETTIPSAQKDSEKRIIYNPNTNEISKSGIIISDRLTSSEFRLLHYLINNSEAVVDRDTIIKAVWSNQATTEGVTDQALDQLLFRVRKKIEDDPNNPSHIQTVKGRGIRFTP